ncbi:MAG: hypothetical protein A2Y38_24755 [Spirochaetes bacterium GWB1_59_5]|nr:MAG: hypothetical protein A2Y38_24755 [Spirochaetes bacterium GWB1_59_5]
MPFWAMMSRTATLGKAWSENTVAHRKAIEAKFFFKIVLHRMEFFLIVFAIRGKNACASGIIPTDDRANR